MDLDSILLHNAYRMDRRLAAYSFINSTPFHLSFTWVRDALTRGQVGKGGIGGQNMGGPFWVKTAYGPFMLSIYTL